MGVTKRRDQARYWNPHSDREHVMEPSTESSGVATKGEWVEGREFPCPYAGLCCTRLVSSIRE